MDEAKADAVQSPAEAARPVLVLSRFAMDRLLRLRAILGRQREAERMLYGQELAQARALLSRAIFSLYLDCREAGVGVEALALIEEARAASGRSAGAPRSCPVGERRSREPGNGGGHQCVC
jgi:hypothetical protein